MPKTRRPYPVEFREEMVRLVRAGRSPGELSPEGSNRRSSRFAGWVNQADVDDGRKEGLRGDQLTELRSLRRECRILREEKENVWLKQRPGSQRRVRVRHPGGVRVRQRLNPGLLSGAAPPRPPGCALPGGLLRVAEPPLPRLVRRRVRVPGDRIVEVHSRSRGAYGAPRVHAELFPPKAPVWVVNGWPVSCARPAIQGVHRRRKVSTTRRNPQSVQHRTW